MANLDAAGLIRRARAEGGLTQMQLARAAGTSQPAIARYESGATSPAVSTLNRLLAACGHTLIVELHRAESPRQRCPQAQAVEKHREQILAILHAIGATDVRLFGSIARDEAHYWSDIDLLVDFDLDKGIFMLGAAEDELTALLGFPVDLAPVRMLKPAVLARALQDAIPI